jgi:hypothetical protein
MSMNVSVSATIVDKDGNKVEYTKRYLHQRPLSTVEISENYGVCVEGVEGFNGPMKVIRDSDGFKQIRYDYFSNDAIRELFYTRNCNYHRVEIYEISPALAVSKIFFTGMRDFVITIKVSSPPANSANAIYS